MVESIYLSASQNQTLLSRSKISQARDQASNRLATGRRVNNINDDPKDFLSARALSGRAAALREAKDSIGQGISALQATQTGLQAIEDLAQQLKGIAYAAQSADAADLAELTKQFDEVRNQIDSLAGDASYQGGNLVDNPADTLKVKISDQTGVNLTVNGQASDVTALSIGDAASYNNFATQSDIDNAITKIESAVSTVRSSESSIVGNAAILAVREKFDGEVANVLETGAAKLTGADINEEAAKALSANVRDQLSVQSMRIAANSDSLIVDLVSNR